MFGESKPLLKTPFPVEDGTNLRVMMITQKMVNLFGDEITVSVSEAKRKPTVKKGYAGTPGSGPKDETCKSCKFAVRCGNYGSKQFSKCEKMKRHWTSGEGTDILLRSPACRHFEKAIKS